MAKLFDIKSAAVDHAQTKAKNDGVTPEERARIGKKLKDLRLHNRLDQLEVVDRMPKGYRISVGTLQAIEGDWYAVRENNIECYAAFFNTSIRALLREDEPQPLQLTDPLLQDLHEEHIEIARRYMRARKQVRACVELLLDDQREIAPRLSTLVLQIATWKATTVALATAAFEKAEITESVLAYIFQRLAIDTEFLALMIRLAEVPLPSAEDPQAEAPGKTNGG